MWTWRLAVRWPVWQVVLFNMSLSWSELRVWCCLSCSPSMHTHGQINQVVSESPDVLKFPNVQRKVSRSCTAASTRRCLLAPSSTAASSPWFRRQAPTSAGVLRLSVLQRGFSALVAWLGSDKLMLAAGLLRLEWKRFCGRWALRSLIWIRAQLSKDSWAEEWSLWVQLRLSFFFFFTPLPDFRLTLGCVCLWIISSSVRSASQQLSVSQIEFLELPLLNV